MRLPALLGGAVATVAVLAGCAATSPGVHSDAPLAVYLSVPLSGKEAAKGMEIAASARKALADAGGKAGDHPLELHVEDDTGGGSGWTPVAAGANAREATENADTIAYIGDLDEGATRTSLPITDLADVPQIVIGPVPTGLDVGNLVDAPSVHAADPGAASIQLLVAAIEAAGGDGSDRKAVLDELKTAAADQAAGSSP
jgi:hypothetical protein